MRWAAPGKTLHCLRGLYSAGERPAALLASATLLGKQAMIRPLRLVASTLQAAWLMLLAFAGKLHYLRDWAEGGGLEMLLGRA